ncbi:glycoside hydrolase family 76 protein [Aureibacillus halotolerans]|uniref:Putative alpha-1,6-mannanase (GH76 family) n=1 Tax=Aureibacillus halotolerans TaxID=1508390 RepID=A0A4R6U344_9BACI|nr:glycoside hydrolase family 76 protein [Aureibacillus halotolerans]TDQ40800.1 putative alpha-1,6-mannanase (GH76 family) [Aureibacillus halotolerans]
MSDRKSRRNTRLMQCLMASVLATCLPLSTSAQFLGNVDSPGRASEAQASLDQHYWNAESGLYNNAFECNECNGQFHYWWQAHALDTLIDGYERTGDLAYLDRAEALYEGVLDRNNDEITNDFYDDMLWMALALLRLYEHTDEEHYKQAVLTLWGDIKTGWNNSFGGGIAWNKGQLDYKNTPSNGPAVILAARLYDAFGNEEDLLWAEKIYSWLTDTLVDPNTGIVWDGINRTGDGTIDKNWIFTYTQGVYIGAAVELYHVKSDPKFLEAAYATVDASIDQLTTNGIVNEQGTGDGGLFKGIYIRYITELYKTNPTNDELGSFILANAESAWAQTSDADGAFFGARWMTPPEFPVQLSQQLSGVMLMEHAAVVEQLNLHGSSNEAIH